MKDAVMASRSHSSGSRPKKVASLTALAELLTPGERVYLPGSTGEPPDLTDALLGESAPPLAITATYVPGVNAVPVERFSPGTTWTSMFAPPTVAQAQGSGIFRHLPLSYSAFARHLQTNLQFDTCIVHVAPPEVGNAASLRVAPSEVNRRRRVLAGPPPVG